MNGSMESLNVMQSPLVGLGDEQQPQPHHHPQANKRVHIGEDLDPALLAVAHPLVILKKIGELALEVIPDFASQPPQPVAKVTPSPEVGDVPEEKEKDPVVEPESGGDAPMEQKEIEEDVGSEQKQQESVNGKSGKPGKNVTASNISNGGGIVLDKKYVELQHRRLSLIESLDLLSVSDFIREFGEDMFAMKDASSMCLGTLETIIYEIKSNYARLLNIYVSLLLYIYPRARFEEHRELIDIPAHLSHHFACSITASTSFGAFIIDARYLCKIFSQMDFLDIPAPFHAAALTCLITSVQAQKRFHVAVGAALEKAIELKTPLNQQHHRQKDLRILIRSLESEKASTEAAVKQLEVVVEDITRLLETGKVKDDISDEAAATAPPRNLSPEERAKNETTLRETKFGIENYRQDLISKQTVLDQYTAELAEIDAKVEDLKAQMARNASRAHGSRLLGYDRYGSQYLWVDLGYNDEQSFAVPNREVVKSEEAKPDATADENAVDESPKDESKSIKSQSKRYRVVGIIADSSYAFYPESEPASALTPPSNSTEPVSIIPHAPSATTPASRYTFIDSVQMFKAFTRSLNDRGNRERELIAKIREQISEIGVTFPGIGLKRAWESYEAAPLVEAEVEMDAGMCGFSAWIDKLGEPLASSPKTMNASAIATTAVSGSTEKTLPDGEANSSSDSLASVTSAVGLRSKRLTKTTSTSTTSKPIEKETGTTYASPAHKEFEKQCIRVAKSRLKELMPLLGTISKSGLTVKKEKEACEALTKLTDATELARTIVSRKFGRNTVSEIVERLERCESWSMYCVLLLDVIREAKARKLNDWVDETKDGGWVEEEEDTIEADENAKGKGLEKPRLTRRPRKVVKKTAQGDDDYKY
ncbi:UNVERIFIED_CONTAM: hypothetical protein HDU68_004000 [Siphonaria sp. JEL0065]|nr:hypothetical protein HDU68_004000 [Siphonaria sp. JEL0065]